MTHTQTHFTFKGLNLVPENFVYVGYYFSFRYSDGDGGTESEEELEVFDQSLLGLTGEEATTLMGSRVDPDKGVPCNCCNHKIKRGMFFQDKQTHEMIYVGIDCARSIMKYNFDVAGAKKQTLANRKKQERLNHISATLSANPNLDELLTTNHKIVRDIAKRFQETGKISDKQIDLVKKLAVQRSEYEKSSKEVVEGKMTDEFTVVSIKIVGKSVEAGYNKVRKYYGLGMLLQHKDGWKLYGTLVADLGLIDSVGPSSDQSEQIISSRALPQITGLKIDDFVIETESEYLKGKISLTRILEFLKGKKISATLTSVKSNTDPYFGSFKRISKLKLA